MVSMPPFGAFFTKQKKKPHTEVCPSECDDRPESDRYFNILTLNTSVILSSTVTCYSVHYLRLKCNNNTLSTTSPLPSKLSCTKRVGLTSPYSIQKLDYPFSVVCICLFSMSSVGLHIWWCSPSVTLAYRDTNSFNMHGEKTKLQHN